MGAILTQVAIFAIIILLICGIAIVILLLIGARLQKNRIWKLLFYLCALIISASTIFATIVISHLDTSVEQYNSSYIKFHSAAPLGASVNILTTEDARANTVFNIHARTGELNNQYTIQSSDVSSNLLQQENDTLYSVNNGKDASITAIDAHHNVLRWRHKLTPATLGTPKTFDDAFTAKPAIDGNYVYLSITMTHSGDWHGENDICLFQTNDGTLVICHRLNTFTNLQGPPDLTVKGDTIFINLFSGQVKALDQVKALSSKDFSLLWSHPFIEATILGVQDFCYVYDIINDTTMALRLTDGTVAWNIDGGPSSHSLARSVTATHFYQYEDQTHFAAYNLQTGSKDWSVAIAMAPSSYSENSYASPVESNNLVYVYSARREISSYEIVSGEMHSHTVLHLITAPPSGCEIANSRMNVINNVLFVVTLSQTPPRGLGYFSFSPPPDCDKEFITALNPIDGFQYWEYINNLSGAQDTPLWIVK